MGLENVSLTAGEGDSIPPMLFMAFQMTFAIPEGPLSRSHYHFVKYQVPS